MRNLFLVVIIINLSSCMTLSGYKSLGKTSGSEIQGKTFVGTWKLYCGDKKLGNNLAENAKYYQYIRLNKYGLCAFPAGLRMEYRIEEIEHIGSEISPKRLNGIYKMIYNKRNWSILIYNDGYLEKDTIYKKGNITQILDYTKKYKDNENSYYYIDYAKDTIRAFINPDKLEGDGYFIKQ